VTQPQDPDELARQAATLQTAAVASVAAALAMWAAGDTTTRPATALLTSMAKVATGIAAFARQAAAAVDSGWAAGWTTPIGGSRPRTAPVWTVRGRHVQRLTTAETAQAIEATAQVVRRWATQAYETTIAQAVAEVQHGHASRLEATQRAWDQLIRRGSTGFVDREGRRWELAAYLEMAVRTGVAQATAQGVIDRAAASTGMVLVPPTQSTCRLCSPWLGKILAVSGSPGTVVVAHPVTRQRMRVTVAGTVAQAASAGLWHPNCRHRPVVYVPGVTTAGRVSAGAVAAGDARQRQRQLERRLRMWRRREAAALTPAYAARARDQAAVARADLAEHTRVHGLRRKPEREQPDRAR